MTELEQIWRNKTDAQVASAMESPQDFMPDARPVIEAEFHRRQLGEREVEPDRSSFQEFVKGLPLASRGERLAAQMVDSMIAFVPVVVGMGLSQLSDLFGEIYAVAAILFFLWYMLFADAMRGGQSWGKRALGLSVVGLSTLKPCTAQQSFLRNLPLLFLGILDWLFIFGRMRRRLGDFLAGTIVIKRSHPE